MMPTDLETEVAEAKCFGCAGIPNAHEVHDEPCSNCCFTCGGTHLRWPGLSWQPECGYEYQDGTSCSAKMTGERVPDVTVERVLDVANREGSLVLLSVMAAIGGWYSGHSEQGTLTDAVCAALLASTEN